jgi:hypothetical protein
MSDVAAEDHAPLKRGRGRPKSIPSSPPEARAPSVLAYLEASKPKLEALQQQVAELALAAAEGVSGGRGRLVALCWKIRAVQFEIDSNAKAHELALELDEQAAQEWRDSVQAMEPEKLVAGITSTRCCRRCTGDHGCVITAGGQCAHPVSCGRLPVQFSSDTKARQIYAAATEAIQNQTRAMEH